MYIYNARTTGYLNISHLLIYIKSIKNIEKKLCENDTKRKKKFDKKWKNVLKKLIKKKKECKTIRKPTLTRTCLNEHLNKEKTSDKDMSDYS